MHRSDLKKPASWLGRDGNILVIVNPASGRGRRVRVRENIRHLLQRITENIQWHETRFPGDATQVVGEAAPETDAVIAVGGDGTINEVVNGLANKQIPLGIIPVGTGNDFVRTLGIPRDLSKAVNIIGRGDIKKIDLGLINSRYFCNGCGIGFDAFVVRKSKELKWIRSDLVYFLSVVRCIFTYTALSMRIAAGDTRLDQRTLFVNAANGVFLGGGIKIAPDALPDDGLFDICIIDQMKRLKMIKNLAKVYAGDHISLPETTMTRTPQLTIHCDHPVDAHVDGEVLAPAASHFKIDLIPSALRVIHNSPEDPS